MLSLRAYRAKEQFSVIRETHTTSFLAASIFFMLVTNTVPSDGDYQISRAEGTVAKPDKSGRGEVG